MTFAERLESILKEKNISKKALLTELNLGKNQFAYWKNNGSVPNIVTVRRIADHLNISVNALLENDCDEELNEHIMLLKTNENYRMMFLLLKNAKDEEIAKAVKAVKTLFEKTE